MVNVDYKQLYAFLVTTMAECIDLIEDGRAMQARAELQKALWEAEESAIESIAQ